MKSYLFSLYLLRKVNSSTSSALRAHQALRTLSCKRKKHKEARDTYRQAKSQKRIFPILACGRFLGSPRAGASCCFGGAARNDGEAAPLGKCEAVWAFQRWGEPCLGWIPVISTALPARPQMACISPASLGGSAVCLYSAGVAIKGFSSLPQRGKGAGSAFQRPPFLSLEGGRRLGVVCGSQIRSSSLPPPRSPFGRGGSVGAPLLPLFKLNYASSLCL